MAATILHIQIKVKSTQSEDDILVIQLYINMVDTHEFSIFDLKLGLGSPPTNGHLHSKGSDIHLNAFLCMVIIRQCFRL